MNVGGKTGGKAFVWFIFLLGDEAFIFKELWKALKIFRDLKSKHGLKPLKYNEQENPT